VTPTLPSVLLTYAWCRVSYVILHSLTNRGVRVHLADASSVAMCRYSRRGASFTKCRSPFANPQGYVDDVAAALKKTGATVLLPGHEDILTLARERHRLPKGTLLPAGEAGTLARVTNKLSTVVAARQAGVPVPETFKPETREELIERAKSLEYPVVVKTQIGNSAKGVRIAHTATECLEHFDSLVATYALPPPRWPMVQAFAPGTGYGVCVLYNRGQLRAAFSERYLRCKDGTLGTSVYRESVAAPDLVAHARKLMESLQWHGVAHLDFLRDDATGRSVLIEVNPRFWGALDLAVRAGIDFPWLLYRMAVDGDVEPANAYRIGVRSRWILGEMLHLVSHVRRRRAGGAMRAAAAMLGGHADGFDDFRLSDPVPLGAEFLYYGSRFLATRSTNPVEEGMIG
jgi:predicted ATP-grasp superfamily ATP-dependent carboligase